MPAALATAAAATATAAAVALGAIRWDAWYWTGETYIPNKDIVGQTVTADLQPSIFQFRVPFFGKRTPNGTVLPGLGNSSSVMQQEIAYASSAGINFFAYCTYPVWCTEAHPSAQQCEPNIQGCCADNSALSYALMNHVELAMHGQTAVNLSLILQAHWFANPTSYGNAETTQQQATRYATYFKLSSYQLVHGRPLVFMLGGDAEQLNTSLAALRAASVAAGAGEPYFVFMGNGAQLVEQWPIAQSMNMQAVSAYVMLQPQWQNASAYSTNAAFSRDAWNAAANANVPVVPSITAGWDPRPRELISLPWGDVSCPLGKGKCYMQDPTMPELTQAVRDGIDFAEDHDPPVAIISAWNEYDEGHWISPSLDQGDAKLKAVRAALDSTRGVTDLDSRN